MDPQQRVDQIIDDLYAGLLDRSAWDRAIIGMSDWIGSAGALLMSVDPISYRILRSETHRLNSATVAAYRGHWITEDLRMGPAMRVPVAEPFNEQKLGLRQQWERSAIFNEFLISEDTPYCLATWLHKAPEKMVVLTFQATCKRGAFEDAEVRRMEILIPHVRRAFGMRDRLEAHDVRANTLSAALDALQFAFLVLDARGRILDANSLAEELLRGEPAIRRDADHSLWLREPAGSQLAALLCTGTFGKPHSDGVFNVPRGNGLQNLSVLVAPMPDASVTWTCTDPRWLVFVFDPDRRVQPAVATIAHDLGISEREAEIAALLAMGHDLSVIAQRLNISIHTARSHLRHIFAKTGTRSQVDLVRRILTSPMAYVACKV